MLNTSSDLNKIISVLKDSPFFARIKPENLKSMVKEFTLVNVKRSTFFDPDINMKYFNIILQGRLRVMQIDPKTGRSITMFLLHKGDGFDIFPLLDGKEHIVQSVAVDNLILLRISIEKMRYLINTYPDFNAAFLPYIGDKLRELESFGKSMVFHDTLTRLANLILKFTEENENGDYYPVKLINDLSHEVLAELIGTSRSVLSTQMQKLKKEGVVMGKKGSLVVKNMKKLIEKSENL